MAKTLSLPAVLGLALCLLLDPALSRPLAAREKTNFQYKGVRVEKLLHNGATGDHVDVVILGDGYVSEDLQPGKKFEKDCAKVVDYLFSYSPFAELKAMFNVYAVYAESFDRGAENDPKEDKVRNILDTTFDRQNSRPKCPNFRAGAISGRSRRFPGDIRRCF